MKLTEFLTEGEERVVAAAAYKANVIKAQRAIEELKNNIADHIVDFNATNMQSWGPAGDMEYVAARLAEINESLTKKNEF